MRGPWRILTALAAVWILAAAVVFWMRSTRATPATVSAYIQQNALEGRVDSDRAEIIARLADQINRLDFEQRQELRRTKLDRKFFEQMTPEERQRFLDLTLPEGFRQMMTALNKMDPAKRRKIVERALNDLDRDTPELNDRIHRPEVEKMIEQGMTSFYQDASADVKLDFAPVIEQIQRATQNLR